MASDVQWIKNNTNMYDDAIIKMIDNLPEADMVLSIWHKLLILAGKNNDGGFVYLKKNIEFNYKDFSILLNRSEKKIKKSLEILEKYDLIRIGYHLFVVDFNKKISMR